MSPRRASNAVQANTAAALVESADELARRAYDLRQRGVSWWDIAEQLHLSEAGARAMVAERISAASDLVSEHTKRSLLALEVSRLDEVMRAHWDDALVDIRAAELVLKVIAQRSRLLGLEDMTDQVATHQTVVVAGTSEEYVRSLQLVVGNGHRPALEGGER